MSSQRRCNDEIMLLAIEERCCVEGIVPTDVHYELLVKLRRKLRKEGEIEDEGSRQGDSG